MRTVLILVIAAFLVIGCATTPLYRYAAIEVDRIQSDTNQSSGLTAEHAVDLFFDVSRQLGFTVSGPGRMSMSPTDWNYGASAPESMVTLNIITDAKHIFIGSNVYGTVKEFAAAKNALASFEDALNKRHVRYKIRSGTKIPPP